MPIPSDTSIKIANYKCFADDAQGFESILPINLILGRNNSGKSALLDLIDFATTRLTIAQHRHRGAQPRVELVRRIDEASLRRAFQETTSGGNIGGNHWQFARPWLDGRVTVVMEQDGSRQFLRSDPPFPDIDIKSNLQTLAQSVDNPFGRQKFRRLAAARDVVPEQASGHLAIEPNGSGATTLIQNFINNVDLPSSLVESELLAALNQIVAPDSKFTRITTQFDRSSTKWEVFLEEEGRGRVAMTHSGSGIKTILLVLSSLLLLPTVDGAKPHQYVYAFEELENNLHPALQRRLLAYLSQFAVLQGATFFLTTHSSVAIDMFSNDETAQLVHVTHDGVRATARRAVTYVENRGICDDLDVRASDLLQANGVVWLEGPSDRLYFNRWIALWSQGKIREGSHYQCVFYGGRLLSHLSTTEPDLDAETAIKILRVNRNAMVLIDSDRRSEADPINETKSRILRELQDFGGFGWVTRGREVENYIPDDVLQKILGDAIYVRLNQFDSLADRLKDLAPSTATWFQKNKVLFAEQVSKELTRDALAEHLDLAERLDAVCGRIMQWNGSPQLGAV